MDIELIPQTEIYNIFEHKNSLYQLAKDHPDNMCWLTALYYCAQYLGIENNKKLHKKLSKLLIVSTDLMHIGTENGAMYFPKKYELSDRHIRAKLNDTFKEIGLKVKVDNIISDFTYETIVIVQKYLKEQRQLLTMVKNIDLMHPNSEVKSEVPNHVVVLKNIEDTGDGKVRVVFIDPSFGQFLEMNVGFHAFIQWLQYIWVLEKRKSIFGF